MLEFLSNYYIYFLIAAGVLFFALIGLIVDMKKKREDVNPTPEETEAPAASVPEPPVTEEQPVAPVDLPTPPTEEVVEESIPVPPMPVEEPVSAEVEVHSQPLDNTPVMNFEEPSVPTSEGTSQPVDTTEGLK